LIGHFHPGTEKYEAALFSGRVSLSDECNPLLHFLPAR
jgi:hypothetical protein